MDEPRTQPIQIKPNYIYQIKVEALDLNRRVFNEINTHDQIHMVTVKSSDEKGRTHL